MHTRSRCCSDLHHLLQGGGQCRDESSRRLDGYGPWHVAQTGRGSYDAATKAFTIRNIGQATENRGTFAYTSVKGDFVATCRVTAASQQSVGAGLVMRTDTKPERAFSGMAKSGWQWSCSGRSKRDWRRKPTAFRKDLPFFPLCSSANPDLLKPAFLKRLLRNAPEIVYRSNTY